MGDFCDRSLSLDERMECAMRQTAPGTALRRAIQTLIEDPLAEELLEGKWEKGEIVSVDVRDGALVFDHVAGEIPEKTVRETMSRLPAPGGAPGRSALTKGSGAGSQEASA